MRNKSKIEVNYYEFFILIKGKTHCIVVRPSIHNTTSSPQPEATTQKPLTDMVLALKQEVFLLSFVCGHFLLYCGAVSNK